MYNVIEVITQRRVIHSLFMLLVMLSCANFVFADVISPASNLAGVRQVRERIDVSLSLKGADEFGIESSEVITIVRSALISSGISIAKGGYEIPSVHIAVAGESAGGGGARFSVEIVIRVLIPSPFAKNRSIDAIIWRNSASGNHIMRYDPASKGFVAPKGLIRDRVYDAVREVATRLAADAKIAGKGE